MIAGPGPNKTGLNFRTLQVQPDKAGGTNPVHRPTDRTDAFYTTGRGLNRASSRETGAVRLKPRVLPF